MVVRREKNSFGKHIQAQTIPEWSAHYMSYKGLKKIIKELNAPLSPGVNPTEASKRRLQTVKAAFFFQVDRELEKVNLFYLRKEADAKVRLKSLIEKQKSLIARGPRNRISTIRALREAFIHSRHDLDKLQNFVEINGTGFRKILKKWDKRSKSSTKELYLARQVDVQPCFNQDVIAEFSDTVTKCLSELEHVLEEDTELMAPTAMPSQRDLVPSPAFRSALYPHILTPTQAQPQPELNVQEQEQGQQLQTDLSAPSSDATGKFPSFFRRTSTTFLIDGGLASNIQIDRMEAELFYALLLDSTQIAKDMLATLVAHQTGVAKLCVTRVLWRACSELKDEDKRQLLLNTGMVDFQSADDINERTLAHEAAIHGSACILRAAVAAGVDGDKADYYGRRPMHYAAINGHAACIEYLLNQGCYSVTATDDDGDRAFDYAISNGHADCVQLLISHDRSVITEDVLDYPVLLLACEKGHDNIVTLLLEAGSEIMANSQGVHPAHVAARTGSVNILRLLLEHGAPVDVADKDLGWTPVFYAASEGNIGCIRILVDAGCDLGVTDENNRPPVYYAAYEGHLDSVDLLLEAASRSTVASRRADGEATDVASVLPTVEEQEQIQLQTQTGGDGNDDMAELDLDGIPSLSLPPPLIPFRVYGHNFLGKRTQIQIRMMSRRGMDRQPVTFFDDCDMMSLKLVVMAKPDAGMVPHTVMLPLESTSTTFGFQTDDSTKFRLEFFLYPSFGLQPIGKAVALPSLFNSGSSSSSSNSSGIARLPLLDRYLKLVAEVTFEFLVVRPFEGAQLQIGGKVETYWK
ncbi:ankyrin repeat-containing domain protein, partial [Kickxella alabastrina]|uniref:ankyrin repeat-containing domain protein n=1 Tax=Kickxella alabastrina TaxID=61397 RepID=UPI002220F370